MIPMNTAGLTKGTQGHFPIFFIFVFSRGGNMVILAVMHIGTVQNAEVFGRASIHRHLREMI
jgi:hypothetical protein